MIQKNDYRSMCDEVAQKELGALIEWALELRRSADAEEQRFLLFLVAFDKSEKWRQGVASATFAAFLDKHDIAKPSRYENWRKAVEELPWDAISIIGVHVVEVMKIPAAHRQKAVRRMAERATQNSAPLSRQIAHDIAYRGIDRPTREEQERSRIQQLESELAAAKSRIRELTHAVKTLEKEVERLRGVEGTASKIETLRKS